MPERSIYDNVSVIDHRYFDAQMAQFLSEEAYIAYKLRVEVALVTALYKRGMCSAEVLEEIIVAAKSVTAEQVYEEEQITRHDVRALVNCLQARVSDEAKPFVHLTATSYDIVETADILRTKDAIEVLIWRMHDLLYVLVRLAEREKDTLQVGRTHGQHAVPITFGFAIAEYIWRLGECEERLQYLRNDLVSKFSGAVGTYSASSLLFEDPRNFEAEVLAEVGLKPAPISTQIAPPEPMIRLYSEIIIAMGVMANLADDMRHLQRSEIDEVAEAFGESQVGSSAMPQKKNPITFENVKSVWKIVLPRLQTVYLDQISEHQRDLTNSASRRTYLEIVAYVASATKRLSGAMLNLQLDAQSLSRNLAMQDGLVLAEPLYILLATLGHPDAHEKVRTLAMQARESGQRLQDVVFTDPELEQYLAQMREDQLVIFHNPVNYIGCAEVQTRVAVAHWARYLQLESAARPSHL